MNDDPQRTLFHPFEAGLIDAPRENARVLVLHAPAGFRAPAGWKTELMLVQDLRPVFLALEREGRAVSPQPEGDGYDMTLVLCGRHRGQNERWIAEALRRTMPGGLIVVAGGKTEGAASLRKRMASLVELDGHASKNHGVVFWLRRADEAAALSDALDTANPAMEPESGFRAAPGMFSHDHVDAGSLLLADNLPDELKGAAADFGAGWGYLSVRLARSSPGVGSIDLFEAGFCACEAAKRNLATLAPDVQARVFWRDLLSEPVERRYDIVVMNPPFHQGRAAEPSIGEGMIRAASKALKPGGRLLMVANAPLPYEAVLQAAFARHGEICRDRRFKVLWAAR